MHDTLARGGERPSAQPAPGRTRVAALFSVALVCVPAGLSVVGGCRLRKQPLGAGPDRRSIHQAYGRIVVELGRAHLSDDTASKLVEAEEARAVHIPTSEDCLDSVLQLTLSWRLIGCFDAADSIRLVFRSCGRLDRHSRRGWRVCRFRHGLGCGSSRIGRWRWHGWADCWWRSSRRDRRSRRCRRHELECPSKHRWRSHASAWRWQGAHK